jgi:hypothetical protein
MYRLLVDESDEFHDAERKSQQLMVRLLLMAVSMTIPLTFFFYSGHRSPHFPTPQLRLKSLCITAHRQLRRRHTLSSRLIPQIPSLNPSSMEAFRIQPIVRLPHPLRPQSHTSLLLFWGSHYCFPSFHVDSHWTARRRQWTMTPVHRPCPLRAAR